MANDEQPLGVMPEKNRKSYKSTDQQESLRIQDTQVAVAVDPSFIVNVDDRILALQVAGTPFRQLVKPNPQILCTPGLCLVYAREIFGIGPKYPTAMKGWEASPHKHEDKKYPKDVWVPVWYALSDNPAGHVAVRQPDGSVWSASHPTETKPVHHESLEDMERYFNNKLQYLGWTEDIEDIQVVGRE